MAGFTVIGGPSSEQLARRIAMRLGSRYVACDLRVFPDGESKITLKAKPSGKIIVVNSVYPPVDSNLIRALSLISQARKYSPIVYAVIPYMGYARQDREFLPREVVTMALVANLFKAAGAKKIFFVDIHSIPATKHFQIPAKNITAIGELASFFRRLNLRNVLVVSPDLGGIERARNFAGLLGTDFIALEKHRDRRTGQVMIKSKRPLDVKNRDLILVDDMISTGGSIVKAAEHLKKQGCGKIYAACTHSLLIGNAEKKIKRAGVTKIVGTNTIPGKTAVVDVSPAIARAIA